MAGEQTPASEARENLKSDARHTVPTEEIIGWILRIGVTASAICIALGLLLLFSTQATGYQAFGNVANLVSYSHGAGGRFPTSPGDVISGVAQLKPYALIALGLLLLILTPVMRVAASIVIFLLERDYAYVLITAVVLLILVVSFLLGKTG